MSKGAAAMPVDRGRVVRARQSAPPATQSWLPVALFVAALCGSAVVLSILQSDVSFFLDEFDFLLHRGSFSADSILAPHHEHIAILPVLLYKGLLAVFGMDSERPFQVAATLVFLTAVALAFVYLRRRIGGWLALAGVLPILFFGPSWIDLLWPFQVAFWGSFVGGIGALLLYERDERRTDVLACLLLTVSMASSSLGIPFAIGLAVLIATDVSRARRAFVVAIPVALFAVWWLGWGREADTDLSFDNLLNSPVYVLEGLSASLSSLFGLTTPKGLFPEPSFYVWRWPLLAVVGLLAAVRIYRGGTDRWLWATVAILSAFWFLAALNASALRPAAGSRYQVVGAILLLLVFAELLRGIRVPRGGMIVCLLVALAATASNYSFLHKSWKAFSSITRAASAQLTAIEISADTVALDYSPDNSFGIVDAGSYLSAVDAYGSPAYPQEDLSTAPDSTGAAADTTLSEAEGLHLTSPAPQGTPHGRCFKLGLTEGHPAIPELGRGGALLRPSADSGATVVMRRYASVSFPVALGPLPTREFSAIEIPSDRSDEPWEAAISGSTGFTLFCEIP